jgi:hypothetical protein
MSQNVRIAHLNTVVGVSWLLVCFNEDGGNIRGSNVIVDAQNVHKGNDGSIMTGKKEKFRFLPLLPINWGDGGGLNHVCNDLFNDGRSEFFQYTRSRLHFQPVAEKILGKIHHLLSYPRWQQFVLKPLFGNKSEFRIRITCEF